MRRKFLFMAAVAAAMLLTGCGPKEEPTNTVVLEKIRIFPASISLLEGEEQQLTIRYTPEEAKETAPAVVWYSDKQRVASVDDNGLVTADRVGTTVITAQCGKLEATCEVEVLKNNLPENHYFSVSPKTIEAPGNGGTFTIRVKGNIEWTAEVEADWATLSATSGKNDATLTLTVEPSEVDEETSQTIKFLAEENIYNVVVYRAKKILPMSLDKTEATVKVSGGSFTVNVTSESDWSVSCDDPRVSFSKSNNSVTVNVLQSTSKDWNSAGDYDDRDKLKYWESIPITFSDRTSKAVLTLYQERPYLYLKKGSVFKPHGSIIESTSSDETTFNVDLYSNISWEIKLTEQGNRDEPLSWATVSPTSGTGDASLKIHFDKKTYFSTRKGWLEVYPTGGYNCTRISYELWQW